MVLGFPSNEFAGQEPGSEEEIQAFCRTNFGVQFPLFSKIEVNGAGRHPLYQLLIREQPEAEGSLLSPFTLAWSTKAANRRIRKISYGILKNSWLPAMAA